MLSKCVSPIKCHVRMGLCRKTNVSTNNYLNNKREEWSPVVAVASPIPVKSFTTSRIVCNRTPFEELMKLLKPHGIGSKIFKLDAPLSIKDINGKPIQPIDINIWADPEELIDLFGNIDSKRIQDLFEKNAFPVEGIPRTLIKEIEKQTEKPIDIEPTGDDAKKDVVDKETNVSEPKPTTDIITDTIISDSSDTADIIHTTNEKPRDAVKTIDISELEEQQILLEIMKSLGINDHNSKNPKNRKDD